MQLAVTSGSNAAGAQDLLDGGEQAVAVLDHGAVKLLPLRFFDGAGLQRLQVEADRGDGGLELVRHSVDESVVLFIAPNFANQKRGVEDNAHDDHEGKQRAEEQKD